MTNYGSTLSAPPRLNRSRRKAQNVSTSEMVKQRAFCDDEEFFMLAEPNSEQLDIFTWIYANREWLNQSLTEKGAILFRGFSIDSADKFQKFTSGCTADLLDYKERAAPRIEVASKIYTSTEFPEDQTIPLHHEMSYANNWPAKLWFFCATAAKKGGCTPIASERKVTANIDKKIKQHFMEKKIMYVRNYGEGIDLSWQEAFQTDSKADVEAYCKRLGMTCEWRSQDRLRTRTIGQVMVRHPITGEHLWFNHALLFHMSNLSSEVRNGLLQQFEPEAFPRNVFYGDGSYIEEDMMEELREIYRNNTVRFDWQEGDILMLDNFLSVHGRDPYQGPRKILVAMGELQTNLGVQLNEFQSMPQA